MGKTEELRPCAHCGGKAVQSRESDQWLDHYHHYFIRCTACGAQSAKFQANVDDSHGAVQKAIAAWNRRSSGEQAEVVAYEARYKRGLVVKTLTYDRDDAEAYVKDMPEGVVRSLYASPAVAGGVTEEPEAVKLLRGPLSLRATSPEFNEWQAREVIAHIDRLTAALAVGDEGIRETQASIGRWAHKVFGPVTSLPRAVERAAEELKELHDAAEAGHDPATMIVEAADVTIVLMRFAEAIGQNLFAAVDAKMARNRAREWRSDGTGHGYHTKEAPTPPSRGEGE